MYPFSCNAGVSVTRWSKQINFFEIHSNYFSGASETAEGVTQSCISYYRDTYEGALQEALSKAGDKFCVGSFALASHLDEDGVTEVQIKARPVWTREGSGFVDGRKDRKVGERLYNLREPGVIGILEKAQRGNETAIGRVWGLDEESRCGENTMPYVNL